MYFMTLKKMYSNVLKEQLQRTELQDHFHFAKISNSH